MALLKSVKAKLTTLVALSAMATLAALPLLHWLMTRELVDVVDDRVPEATRGFDLELVDDIHDLEAATKSLGDSDDLQKAVVAKDANAAHRELKVFREAYGGVAFIVYDRAGDIVAHSGLRAPPDTRSQLLAKNADATEIRFIAPTGCSTSGDDAPSVVLSSPIREDGIVVACMPLNAAYLANSSEKLGLELAVEKPDGSVGARTDAFPVAAVGHVKPEELADVDGRAWAMSTFTPTAFQPMKGAFRIVVALDMTRIRGVVRRNLALTVGVLLLAAIIAIVMGTRLATLMGSALSRLNRAYSKVANDEYEHVIGVKTGDEIEALASGFNAMVDGLRERDKLRATMGKYMTQQVMDHLMAGRVELGGTPINVTILFSDIRSFTTISESMKASDLVKLLNEYFTEMVAVVTQEGGVVDKYIGDAIMAVFGAPVPKEDDAVRAVRAAIRMRKALAALNEKLVARGTQAIRTGIGLHTGEVIAGNIGSEERMEYTVIGDAVNLASRLESSTKEIGCDILISEDTYKLLDEDFDCRPVREITVKGRNKPVMVYEVKGFTRSGLSAPPPSYKSPQVAKSKAPGAPQKLD